MLSFIVLLAGPAAPILGAFLAPRDGSIMLHGGFALVVAGRSCFREILASKFPNEKAIPKRLMGTGPFPER